MMSAAIPAWVSSARQKHVGILCLVEEGIRRSARRRWYCEHTPGS